MHLIDRMVAHAERVWRVPKSTRRVETVKLRDAERHQPLYARAIEWGALWGLPRLADSVSFRTSSRFRRSLGSYRANQNEIAIAAWLVEEDGLASLREEVFCHEAAHAAVHLAFGRGPKPHGTEWRDFMARAGFEPRVRIPVSELPEARQLLVTRSASWEHRCPRCQATRLARTRVTRWRCGRCRVAGRAGELVIERLPIASG